MISRHPRILGSLIAFAWTFGLAGATPALAQLRGEVLDPGGAPARDARVELWSALHRVALRRTDALGRFAFTAAERDSATTAIATLGGYEPISISLARIGENVSIHLEPTSVVGLTVQANARPLGLLTQESRANWQDW